MMRAVLNGAMALAALLVVGGVAVEVRARAQPTGEAEGALRAALMALGGVSRARCGAPTPAGTPCVEPFMDEAQARTVPRGIARFSVTFADEPGSYVAVFARAPSGAWGYWFGTQEQLSPLLSLPGELLACAGEGGREAVLYSPERGGSEPLRPLTHLTAEAFVLTQPGVPGAGMTVQMGGSGWYRVSAPAAGWVAERDVTDAAIGDCSIHDAQYGRTDAPGSRGGAMEIVGPVWSWQRTSLNNDEVVMPDDPSKYTVEFLPDGRIAGRADCNRAMGGYTITSNRVEIGPLATTRAACPPGSLSDRFVAQLQEVTSYFVRDGELFLELRFDSGTMRFAKAPPTEETVTGVVTYRERIALPPNARVRVQLADVSRADAPAIVLGEQEIQPAGQVPIPFSIGYRPSEIDPRFTYIIQVRITDGEGRLLFITMDRYAVITGGNPTRHIEVVVRPV